MREQGGSDAAESVVLMHVSLGRFGNSRKGDIGEISTDADKAMLRLGKRLLDAPEYKAVVHHDGETVERVRSRSIPALFKAGIYQVRPSAVERLDEYMRQRQAERCVLVQALCAAYPDRLREASERLGPQFDEANYPTVAEFERTFTVSWRFFTMVAPGKVHGISAEFVRRERERLGQLFEEIREQGATLVRVELKAMVDHFVDKLTPDADGVRKRFHKSAVTRIQDFLEAFDARNVAGDDDVAALVEKMRGLMDGLDPDTLRESDNAKDRVREAFAGMKAQLDALVESAPRRRVDLDAIAEED